MWIRNLWRQICGLALTALFAGLAAATLARLAPGFDADERELDPRLTAASLQAIRDARAADGNLGRFYLSYLLGLSHGELGVSRSLRRPVADLLAERGPVTLSLAGWGLAGGWVFGLGLALASKWKPAALELFSSSLSALFLCLPAAV